MNSNISLHTVNNGTSLTLPEESAKGLNIIDLPIEVIFKIFFDLAQLDLKQASFPLVCKKWQINAHETPLYRLFISQKYPQLDLKTLCGDSFEKAFIFSNQMTRFAHAFSEMNLNILTYNAFKKQLVSLLDQHKDFLLVTPYFDLRPLAWLDRESWVKSFNSIAPLLKNVQELEVKGIGKEIAHQRVKLPHVPVITKVSHISKVIVKGLIGFSGVEPQKKDPDKTNQTLVYCIGVLGNISKKLTTLKCYSTSLTSEDKAWIQDHFPNIYMN